jgi:hypothetical protein
MLNLVEFVQTKLNSMGVKFNRKCTFPIQRRDCILIWIQLSDLSPTITNLQNNYNKQKCEQFLFFNELI